MIFKDFCMLIYNFNFYFEDFYEMLFCISILKW